MAPKTPLQVSRLQPCLNTILCTEVQLENIGSRIGMQTHAGSSRTQP